ncbi:hypothetical protein [Roseibium aggregatum]|uniref:Uncharacterized protein n=1 Tax=Roseibium aggregatum TaxID=187304 RepID=A0A0M6YC71_9HYPH|nr:hypothetical protein [Roseibium aggregatum]CTQ47278.1 hypothetical protein LAL4801_05740 [Roseibium aggregatum]
MEKTYTIELLKMDTRKDGSVSFADVVIDGLTVRLQNKISDGVNIKIEGDKLIAGDQVTVDFIEVRIEAAREVADVRKRQHAIALEDTKVAIDEFFAQLRDEIKVEGGNVDDAEKARNYILGIVEGKTFRKADDVWRCLTDSQQDTLERIVLKGETAHGDRVEA